MPVGIGGSWVYRKVREKGVRSHIDKVEMRLLTRFNEGEARNIARFNQLEASILALIARKD